MNKLFGYTLYLYDFSRSVRCSCFRARPHHPIHHLHAFKMHFDIDAVILDSATTLYLPKTITNSKDHICNIQVTVLYRHRRRMFACNLVITLNIVKP